MAAPAHWMAVDWGTSNLRLWALDGQDAVIAERTSTKGMGRLAPHEFEPALLELAHELLAPERVTDVVICGMAGARQGWVEAPYLPVPCIPTGRAAVSVNTRDRRLRVQILPGLSQSEPADVLRGEETQLAGLLAGDPAFSGVACLPGTHSKWVRLEGGRVESFHTAMTGELFALLAGQSVLRHAVGTEGWDEAAFHAAVDETFSRPQAFALALFSVRSRALLAGITPAQARSRLSGLLIGLELAGARTLWQAGPVVVIGAAGACAPYAAALGRIGVEARLIDGAGLALDGLRAAHRLLKDHRT